MREGMVRRSGQSINGIAVCFHSVEGSNFLTTLFFQRDFKIQRDCNIESWLNTDLDPLA